MLPIEQNTNDAMIEIADNIKHYVGDSGKYGFMVLVFPFGDGVRAAHYISNASREDMIKVLREKSDVLEKEQDMIQNGTVQ